MTLIVVSVVGLKLGLNSDSCEMKFQTIMEERLQHAERENAAEGLSCVTCLHICYYLGPEDPNVLVRGAPASLKSNFMTNFHKPMMQLDATEVGSLIFVEKERHQNERS